MAKKILAAMLALTMCAGLAGCGKVSDNKDSSSAKEKSTAAAIKLIPESNVFFETDADESFLEPAELLEELEGRLESVRTAYAKCRE